MRVVIVGLGVQGRKRVRLLKSQELAGIVDPIASDAEFKEIDEVPLTTFDAAFVCTPDTVKVPIVRYLLANKKHVLVEKPLLANSVSDLSNLKDLALSSGVSCYTAYNHRFEEGVLGLKRHIDTRKLGRLYYAKFLYGNGTARNVRDSSWRDQGLGALSDLGSHLIDLSMLLFGDLIGTFTLGSLRSFENRAPDRVTFSTSDNLHCEFETSFLCWRNQFGIDVFGELGSAHLDGLCKWGSSTLTIRKRVFPSGKPLEETRIINAPDTSWETEHAHFSNICSSHGTNLDSDIMIQGILHDLQSQQKRNQV